MSPDQNLENVSSLEALGDARDGASLGPRRVRCQWTASVKHVPPQPTERWGISRTSPTGGKTATPLFVI